MLKAALVELPESEISDRYWGIFALWLPFCQLFKAVAALCSRETPTTVSVSQVRISLEEKLRGRLSAQRPETYL